MGLKGSATMFLLVFEKKEQEPCKQMNKITGQASWKFLATVERVEP